MTTNDSAENLRLRAWILAGVTLAAAVSASAAIINVPSDVSTIQGALDASLAGDTVLVQPGVYREHVVQGLEQAPQAFLGLFTGANFGKLVVEVS